MFVPLPSARAALAKNINLSNKRDGWKGSARWGLTSSRPEPKVLSAAEAAIVAKKAAVSSGTLKPLSILLCLYHLKFKEKKLLDLQCEKSILSWECPEDALISIFMKVHIFLAVKDSLLNSKCPLEALNIFESHPARSLNSCAVWRSGTGVASLGASGQACSAWVSWATGDLRADKGSQLAQPSIPMGHCLSASFSFVWVNSEPLLRPSCIFISVGEVLSQGLAEDLPDVLPWCGSMQVFVPGCTHGWQGGTCWHPDCDAEHFWKNVYSCK